MENLSRQRYVLLASVTVAVSLLLSIIVIEVVLRWMGSTVGSGGRLDDGLFEYDAGLGWVVSRDWRGGHAHRDYQVQYATNAYGYRGAPIATAKQPGEKRYAYLGDSFTFGMGVRDEETFTSILAQRGNGKLRHLNFGVPGYSTDQEVLFAEDRLERFEPDTVVLVVYLGNDLIDNLAAYPLQTDFAKPYFELQNGALQVRNTPVPRLAKPAALRSRTFASAVLQGVKPDDSLLGRSEILRRLGFRPAADDISDQLAGQVGSSIDLFEALVRRLEKVAQKQRGNLIVVLLPGRSFVHEPDGYSAQYQDYVRRLIMARLNKTDIGVLDLGSELRRQFDKGETDLYFPHDGHLTANGHRIAADFLEQRLP